MARSVIVTEDGFVFNGPCTLVGSIVIGNKGATAGDVFVLRDGGPTGTIVLYVVAEVANSTQVIPLPPGGLTFGTSCYYSEQVAAAGKTRTTVFL